MSYFPNIIENFRWCTVERGEKGSRGTDRLISVAYDTATTRCNAPRRRGRPVTERMQPTMPKISSCRKLRNACCSSRILLADSEMIKSVLLEWTTEQPGENCATKWMKIFLMNHIRWLWKSLEDNTLRVGRNRMHLGMWWNNYVWSIQR